MKSGSDEIVDLARWWAQRPRKLKAQHSLDCSSTCLAIEMMWPVGQKKPEILSLHRRGRESNFDLRFFTSRRRCFLGALDQTIIAAALPAMRDRSTDFLSRLGGHCISPRRDCRCSVVRPHGRRFRRSACWSGPLACLSPFGACAVARLSRSDLCSRAASLGAGALMTLAQALIGEVVSPRERGRFQGWSVRILPLPAHSVR